MSDGRFTVHARIRWQERFRGIDRYEAFRQARDPTPEELDRIGPIRDDEPGLHWKISGQDIVFLCASHKRVITVIRLPPIC